jgi:DNA repair exonuclease SbcCD ATPase subunit
MTFNFDGGDIMVILLMIIAFILYRRFDRTGRSLEKVRRYAEKSKSDLDAIVREREMGLKDLAVDLEVQEKTNREILARAEAAREEIMSRAEELESRVERIEVHERALEDLNDLALRVDENLSRLKDESAYVDDVGRRLSDAREKFSTLEEKDAERFAAFREEVLGVFGHNLNQMQSELSEAERQLELFRETLESLNARRDEEVTLRLTGFRDSLEQVEEEFRERLRKVAEEGSRLEDDAFTALNEKIERRSERLENNWLTGMTELKDRVSSTAAEIQDSLTEARNVMETWETESTERLENVSGGFSEME